jgi:Mrp family chromosome partitioning ATPase/capsular polysaccharide biosynthesis protein
MNETTDAPSILAPLWRRKWLILIVGLVVAAGTYVYYNRQAHVYQSTTQLFLGSGAEEQAQLTSTSTKRRGGVLNSTNQAALINSNVIKEAVHNVLRKEHKGKAVKVALHGKAHAVAKEKSEFITLTATAHDKRAAALLVNVTAQTYIHRQTASYQRQIERAIALTRRQLRRLEASQEVAATPSKTAGAAKGSSKPAEKSSSAAVTLQTTNLNAKINQLESQLFVANIKQIEPAKPGRAVLLRPKPKENAIFAFAVGILLAAIAAYLLDRLDRRLRSLAQVEASFHAPILTVLPSVRHPVARSTGQSVPAGALREPVRRLHMALKVGEGNAQADAVGARPRVILFTSADPGDGKSTVVADLAVTQRDAGERVAVVEADFRRPSQAKLLGVTGPEGLVDVLEGRLVAEEAMLRTAPMQPLTGVPPHDPASGALATMSEPRSTGYVSVLLGSSGVSDPSALLARPAMADLLRSLADDHDYVLIDAPVPLQVSDAIPLLGAVDAIVIVARVGHTSEVAAQRLVQLLERTPSAPVLGVVANAVPNAEIKKYGFSTGGGRRWRRVLTGR